MPGMSQNIKIRKGRVAAVNAAPVVTITSGPPTASTGSPDTPFTFTATAIDAEDGDITANIVWTSSLATSPAGATGGSFAVTSFDAAGANTVTATVTDSGSLVGTDTEVFTVT